MQQNDFNPSEVLYYLRQVFGGQCEIETAAQFKGGARKQVFFIDLKEPNQRCVLYIWHDLNRYFPEREGIDSTHSDANAPTMFKLNCEYLFNQGVNVPQLHYMGKLDAGHDFALLEYVDGGNYTQFAQNATPGNRDAVLKQIGAMLRILNDTQRPYPGTLLDISSPSQQQCSELMLNRALLEIESASATHANVAEHKERISHKLRDLHARLAPRSAFRLIHGELGPEHILIRKADHKVYFVDVEGIHFFDAESEHALMKFRFTDEVYSRYFMRDDLDIDRMEFYRLALHVSFVYAGTRFVLGNFHDQEWAQTLFTFNLERVLQIVESPHTEGSFL